MGAKNTLGQPMNYEPSHGVILIPQAREKNLELLLDASSLEGQRSFPNIANDNALA